MEVDKRLQLRQALHGMGPDIFPSYDCVCKQFSLPDNGDRSRRQHQSLKDGCRENINLKWDPYIKNSLRSNKQRDVVVKNRDRLRAGVSPRGDLRHVIKYVS